MYIFLITIKPISEISCSIQLKWTASSHIFIVIEKITSQGDAAHIDRLLLTRKAYWTAQLCTLNPHGLNKRREFMIRSKNRVLYNT